LPLRVTRRYRGRRRRLAKPQALAFGPYVEAPCDDHVLARLESRQHGDAVSRRVAEANRALDQLAIVRRVGDVDHAPVCDRLDRRGRDRQLRRPARGRSEAHVGEHPQPQLVPRIRHLDAGLGGPRLRTHPRIDVVDASRQREPRIGRRRDGGWHPELDAAEIPFIDVRDDPDAGQVDDREQRRRRLDVEAHIGRTIGDDARQRRPHLQRDAGCGMAGAQVLDRVVLDTQQPQARRGAVDGGPREACSAVTRSSSCRLADPRSTSLPTRASSRSWASSSARAET
jgi:hypothetical protein